MKRDFSSGQRIDHIRYGAGKILEEWGCWTACGNCFVEKRKDELCLECKVEDALQIRVSGRGTYEVKFEDGTKRVVHRDGFR